MLDIKVHYPSFSSKGISPTNSERRIRYSESHLSSLLTPLNRRFTNACVKLYTDSQYTLLIELFFSWYKREGLRYKVNRHYILYV